ncbi:MAG: amidohydrolase family protein [Longimicrobiales bacterium]
MQPARYAARWVLPVHQPAIREGAVLVDAHGRIAEVGPAAAVALPESAREVDLGDAALLPGLVNTHAHLDLSFLRGHLEDRSFPDWLAKLKETKRGAGLLDADQLAATRWSCIEAIGAGITTLGATEDSSAAMEALRESGLRGIVYREVFGPAPAQANEAMAGLCAAISAMREFETERVRAGVSPHAPYTVSDALYQRVAAFARDEALPVAVHIAESEAEQRLVTHGDGIFAQRHASRGMATPVRARSPIELLRRTGILDLHPLLIHCVRIDAMDIDVIAASRACVAHCPVANARLGHGIAPVTDLQHAGIVVGLGTDSVASNNRMDLLEEARFAQIVQRASRADAMLVPAAQLLRLVTIEGARALGLDARIGSLEPGKDADLCAVSFAAPHVRPVHDPLAALFHAARASDVCLTVVCGEVLFQDGAWITLDVEAVGSAVEALAARVR